MSNIIDTIGGTALGLMLQGHNDKRQIEQQKKLGQQQLGLNIQQMAAQKSMDLQMWKDTNYSAQVEEMEKAGINPALLYGKGGGGGTTIGNSGGNVGGGQAPQGGGEIMGMMMQKAQLDLMKAQTEATAADANLKYVDAAKKAGVDTENVKADTESKLMEKIIKEYTGQDLKDVYEKVKVPNRGIEEKTYQDELVARQGIAETIGELWEEGKLKDKGNYEIEQLLQNNAKTRQEVKNIIKAFDILEEELKGAKLDNILKDVEAQWATGTGLKGGDVKDIAVRIIGALLGMKIGKKPSAGITINNLPRK